MDYNKMIKTHEKALETLNERIAILIEKNETGQLLNIQKFIREEINIIDNLSGLNKNDDKEEEIDNIKQEDKLDYFNNFKNCMVLNDKELDDGVRILSCDIGIATGENEYCTYCHIGTYNKDNDRRKSFIVDKFKGNSKEVVDKIYNLFYDNQCDYLLFSIKGIGNVIYDMLIQKKLSVIDNEFLNVSSDECIKNLKGRNSNSNNLEVIIPFYTTLEMNSDIYFSLNKNLKDYNLLLQNDEDTDNIYELIKKSSLQITNGYLKFLELRGESKEDFITLCMFNYFCDKLKDYYKNENKNEILPYKVLIGTRGSGISSTLLTEAQLVNGIYVCKTKKIADTIKYNTKNFLKNLENVKTCGYDDLKNIDYNLNTRLFIELPIMKYNQITTNKIKNELKKIGISNIDIISTVGIDYENNFYINFPYFQINNSVKLREDNRIGKIIEMNLPKYINYYYKKEEIKLKILFENRTEFEMIIKREPNLTWEKTIEKHFKQIGNKKFKDTLD